MALRIRRGTEAQLQLTTPVEGELIYTTDSKDLFVGDGTTLGGIKVGGDIPASINDLTDVNIAGIAVGQVLKWNGTAFVPGNDDTTVGTGSGVVEGSNYRINIVADDSTTLVDVNNRYISGLIIGDLYDEISQTVVVNPNTRLSKLDIITDSGTLVFAHNTASLYSPSGELIIDGNSKTFFGNISINSITADLKGSVFADDSSLIIDSVNNKIFGNVYGDVYNNLTDQLIIDTFVQEAALDIVTDTGDLILDHSNGNLYNNASQLLIDGSATTFYGDVQGTLTGTVIGDVTGDIRGSVFNNGSDLVIDGQTGWIYAITIAATTNNISIEPNLPNIENEIRILSDEQQSNLKFTRRSTSDLALTNEALGAIYFEKSDINGNSVTATIAGRANDILFAQDSTGNFSSDANFCIWTDGKFGIGTLNPTNTFEVVGSAKFTGDVNASAFVGSLMADDSTTIIDAINGTIYAKGFIQFGSYTDGEISTIVPVNGMVYYNTTNNRFRGFQNGSWINLDDGSAV